MLTQADLKVLNSRASRTMRRVIPAVLILIGLFLVGFGIANVVLASKFAAFAQMSLSDVYSLWFSGFKNQAYPGVAIRAVDRLSTGALQISLGIPFFPWAFASWKQAQWFQRIRDALHAKDA